ncbi:MAG: class II glutamine amidotransferase, partial [Proteobacteria bacterium]|nr:class II glutamine amidotransferase [Pseudomonadota bacterium]
PALFKSIQPAWNDLNLEYLASKIRSDCFFTHIRAASKNSLVTQLNCHPFRYKQLLFMHNGDIGGFQKIKRHLRHELPDEIYDWIKGQTDSEHFLALFAHLFEEKKAHFSIETVSTLLKQTIQETEKLKKKYEVSDTSYVNAVITDGKSMVCIRYISNVNELSPTLYYAAGGEFRYHDGNCHIEASSNGENGAVLIASEKLTNHKAEWHEIPVNHMLLIDEDYSTTLKAI